MSHLLFQHMIQFSTNSYKLKTDEPINQLLEPCKPETCVIFNFIERQKSFQIKTYILYLNVLNKSNTE